MTEPTRIDRRRALRLFAVTGLAGGMAGLLAPSARAAECVSDGTPMQFIPKTQPDPEPLTDELKKYPKCPYCGMDRKQWHHSRHLVHYADDLVDGTCSLHCAALSMGINLDRGPKAIYAADFGADAEPRPLIPVERATYLIGSDLKGTMTTVSKMAFASADAAKAAQARHGGALADFDTALRAAYSSLAEDTIVIRKRRAEKRRKMMEKTHG